MVLFISAKAKEKNLFIETIFHDSPINYVGDRLMLHRIILNIVSNAIKFTHAGGITITTCEKQANENQLLIIAIKDTGIGIDEKFHEYIFEPFNRIELDQGTKSSGIGLGLSNVRLMLKKMKGEVCLQSVLGKGSTFSLVIPIS